MNFTSESGISGKTLHERFSGVVEEKVCDCFRDGEAWRLFEPEEFATRIELDKDVPFVGCEDDVDGAVIQGEIIHQAQDFFLNVERELVGPPFLKHPHTIAAPVVSGARGDL